MKKNWSISTFSEQIDLAVLLAGLPERYALQEDDGLVETICYLDTFDWRLYDKGLLCRRQGGQGLCLD